MKLLGNVQSVNVLEFEDGMVTFVADADIDCDGAGGNPDNDRYFQPDTTYHFQGKALDAYKVPYVVVPPLIVQKTKGIVFGCRALVSNLLTQKTVECVVADLGPRTKIGEISVAAAKAIGLPSNPNTGGTEDDVIGYQIWPDVPAEIDGVTYTLQKA